MYILYEAWVNHKFYIIALIIISGMLAMVLVYTSQLSKTITMRTSELSKTIGELEYAITSLQQDELRYKELAELLPEVVFEVDITGKFLFVNRRGFEKFNYSADDFEKGLFAYNMLAQEDKSKFFQNLERLIRGEKSRGNEYKAQRSDGATFPVLIYTSTVIIENKVTGFRGVLVDITKLKETERGLVFAKERAEEADKLKSRFLANISHEIRTPLNGIIGFSELMLSDNPDEDKKLEFLKIIIDCGYQLSNIVNDLLDISKIETGQVDIRNCISNVNMIMDETFSIFNSNSKYNNILTLNTENKLLGDAALIMVDETRLRQILATLINNAQKFTHNGKIELGYSLASQNRIQFYVKDNGIGIAKENQELIFERFRQVNDFTTRTYDGTGLGLAITKGLLDKMHGNIWLESEVGKGSTFFFSLPYKNS